MSVSSIYILSICKLPTWPCQCYFRGRQYRAETNPFNVFTFVEVLQCHLSSRETLQTEFYSTMSFWFQELQTVYLDKSNGLKQKICIHTIIRTSRIQEVVLIFYIKSGSSLLICVLYLLKSHIAWYCYPYH